MSFLPRLEMMERIGRASRRKTRDLKPLARGGIDSSIVAFAITKAENRDARIIDDPRITLFVPSSRIQSVTFALGDLREIGTS